MDIATLAGLLAGVTIIGMAVAMGSDFWIFVNVPGIMIVLGGTAAAVLIKFPLRTCLRSLALGLRAAFLDRTEQPLDLIRTANQLAKMVRNQGVLALEHINVHNDFFHKGLQLVADGHKPEFIEKVLTVEMNQSIERQLLGERIFRAVGDSAPAFGLIGTLVGLVQMLSNMKDPGAIGLGMAVALLTTLYGALLANLVAFPIAEKLEMRAMNARTNKSLIIDIVLNVQQGKNPRAMDDLLESYMSHDERRGIAAPPLHQGK